MTIIKNIRTILAAAAIISSAPAAAEAIAIAPPKRSHNRLHGRYQRERS